MGCWVFDRLAMALIATVLLAAVMPAAAAASPLAAQIAAGSAKGGPPPPALPEDLAPDAVDAFAAALTDREARDLLIAALKERAAAAAAAVPAAGETLTLSGLLGRLHHRHELLEDRLAEAGRELMVLPEHGAVMLRNLTDQEGWPAVGRSLLILAALLAAGAVFEFLYRRITRGICERLAAMAVQTLAGRLGAAVLHFVLDALGLAAFALTTYAASFLFFERFSPLRLLIMSIVVVVVFTRAALIVIRAFLASPCDRQPLVPIPVDSARDVTKWFAAIVVLFTFYRVASELLIILGLPVVLDALFRLTVSGVLAAMVLTFIWRQRAFFAALIGGAVRPVPPPGATGRASTLGSLLASAWHLFAMAYVVALWLVFSEAGLLGRETPSLAAPLSLALIIFAPLIDWLLREFLAERSERRRGAQGDSGGVRAVHAMILNGVRLALAGLALGLLAEGWGAGLLDWLATPTGAAAGRAAVQIVLALTLASLAWAVVKRLTDRALAAAGDDGTDAAAHGDDEAGSMVAKSRGQTLVPLLRTSVLVVLVAMVVMIVLSALGVNIGPLLAGAGVVGIAIGFGAQALVRDILSGIFFLIDDAFRIGEYIEISNDLRGEVERISIRSMQLRHHRGMLLTLPFGELRSIINHNRDWAIYKQEFRVAYDTDLEKVRKIIKKLGQQLMADPEYGPKLLEPLKSQGVLRIEESALIVRTKFKCKPREQFVLRRVVFERVKRAFAENGIVLAHRTVNVALPKAAGEPEAVAAAAAAAAGAVIAGDQAAKAPGGHG